MANKQINELTEKTDVLHDDDLILVYDSEEVGSEKTKKVAISNYVASINEATTLYVDPAGNDTTGDGSIGNPWATPHKAMEWLSNKFVVEDVTGDTVPVTIKLADGTYSNLSRLFYNHNGNRVVIEGNETTPSNVVLNFDSNQHGFQVTGPEYLNLRGVKLVGNSTGENRSGLFATNNGMILLYKCIMNNWAYGASAYYGGTIYVSAGSTGYVDGCNVGLLSQGGTIIFRDGAIDDNTTYGAQAKWAGQITIVNSTFSGNGTNTNTSDDGRITIT